MDLQRNSQLKSHSTQGKRQNSDMFYEPIQTENTAKVFCGQLQRVPSFFDASEDCKEECIEGKAKVILLRSLSTSDDLLDMEQCVKVPQVSEQVGRTSGRSQNTPKSVFGSSDLMEINLMDREEFSRILIEQLVEVELGFQTQVEDQITAQDVKRGYEKLLSRLFGCEQLSATIFLYSLAIAKRLARDLKKLYHFERGEFLFVYAGTLLLSLKLLDDINLWFAKDLAEATGISVGLITEMELFVLEEVLQFKLEVSSNILEEEWLEYQNYKSKKNLGLSVPIQRI